jgi:hypothetical protein
VQGSVERNGPEFADRPPQPVLETDSSIHWSSLAYELGLQGLAQEIAVNSTLDQLDESHFYLNLNAEILKLSDPLIEDEIRQAIASKLGVSLNIELRAQDQLQVETPRLFLQRRLQEQREAVIEEIKQDSIVRKLGDAFDAELIVSSVRKIDETDIPSDDA